MPRHVTRLVFAPRTPRFAFASKNWRTSIVATATSGVETRAIDARLEQYGCFIIGIGHVQGEPGDPFQYHGVIKRNVLYGRFRRKDSNLLAGTGAFVVKMSTDLREMTGQCSWYENSIDGVWDSGYIWTRKG